MTTEQKQNALYVGIDIHKDSHTAVGLSPFGEKLFEITIGNYKSDFKTLEENVEKIKGNLSPYFGLEDCHGYGERLSAYLVENGAKSLRYRPSWSIDFDLKQHIQRKMIPWMRWGWQKS